MIPLVTTDTIPPDTYPPPIRITPSSAATPADVLLRPSHAPLSERTVVVENRGGSDTEEDMLLLPPPSTPKPTPRSLPPPAAPAEPLDTSRVEIVSATTNNKQKDNSPPPFVQFVGDLMGVVWGGAKATVAYPFQRIGANVAEGAVKKAAETLRIPLPQSNSIASGPAPPKSPSTPAAPSASATPSSVSSFLPEWAQAAAGFFQNPSQNMKRFGMRLLRKGLDFLISEVKQRKNESLATLGEAWTKRDKNGHSGLTRSEEVGHLSKWQNADGIVHDLNRCISIVDEALRKDDGYKEAFDTILKIMRPHPIWVHSLFQIPILGMGASELNGRDTVEAIRGEIQAFEQNNPYPKMDEHFNYEAGVKAQMQRLAEIGSYMGTFKTVIGYFMGDPPHPDPGHHLSFQMIMKQIEQEGVREPEQRRERFLEKMQEEISKRTDIFFLKRWGLQLILPIVLWACELAAERFSSGAKKYLKTVVANARSPATDAVSNIPIEILTQVVDGMIEACEKHAEKPSRSSRQDFINAYLGGRDFLNGYPDLKNLCEQFGVVAVDNLLVEFKPTSLCDRISNELRDFSSSNNTAVEICLSIFTIPLRCVVWTVRTVIVLPVEWSINKIIKSIVKSILQRTGFIENLTKMTRKALFPESQTDFTEVVDRVILELFQKFRKVLNSPRDPNSKFENLPINESTNQALEVFLHSLYEYLRVMRLDPHGLQRTMAGHLNWYEQMESSIASNIIPTLIKGVVGVLNRSYQIFMNERMLNQQVYLALEASIESMLKQGVPLSREEMAAKGQQHKSNRIMIRHYINLLLWESVKMATAHLTNGVNTDGPITNHVAWLKTKFLGIRPVHLDATLSSLRTSSATMSAVSQPTPAPQTLGCIDKWKRQLEIACTLDSQRTPTTLENLHEIYKEVLEVYTHMQEEIITMETDNTVGGQSLDVHRSDITKVRKKLGDFRRYFLDIYYHHLKNALPPNIITHLSTIARHCNDLSGALDGAFGYIEQMAKEWCDGTRITEMQATLGEIEGLGQQLFNSSKTTALPGDLREFLQTLRAEIDTYRIQFKALKGYAALITFSHKGLSFRPGQSATVYRRDIQPFFAALSAIDRKKISDALESFEKSQQTERDFNTFKSAVEKLVSSVSMDLRTSITPSIRGLHRIFDVSHRHIQAITRAQNTRDPNPLETARVGINQALDSLKRHIEGLRDISSIQIRVINQNGFVEFVQHQLYQQLSSAVNDMTASFTQQGAPSEAILSRVFMRFLDTHGVRASPSN